MKRYPKGVLSQKVRRNIKKYRNANNITLQELADLTGLSHGYVRDLESFGIEKTPRLDTIGRLADGLNIDVRQLFDDIEGIDY